jgi:hypothetical protein
MPKGFPKNGINNGWFKKGQKVWNDGLTKETNPSVKKISEKISKSRKGKWSGKDNPNWVEKIERKCEVCQKEFQITPFYIDISRFCSKECRIEWTRNFMKGENNPAKRKEVREKISEKNSKENHYRWNPDREVVLKNQRNNNHEDKEWALAVKKRDGWRCKMNNNNCEGKIIAHHILRWSTFPELRYKINNGITLCEYHHPKKVSKEKELIQFFQKMIVTQKCKTK